MALGLSLILTLPASFNSTLGRFLAIGGFLACSLAPFLGFWGALVVALIVPIRRLYGRDPLFPGNAAEFCEGRGVRARACRRQCRSLVAVANR